MQVTFDNPGGVPAPAGSYSHVARVQVGDAIFLYLSGQIAQDGEGNIVGGADMGAQAAYIHENIRTILAAHGATMADVIKMSTYVTDMGQVGPIRDLRARYFSEPFPTSTLVEVSRLAREGWLVEIEVVAAIPVAAR
jgi:enamine deaminase RidA (YjgF/YER057c/UK114 family)